MPLPLFALGALLTGGGIAKGLWDESEEKKKQRAMLDALRGATSEYGAAVLNPGVTAELQATPNPIMGRPTPELAANPRSAADPRAAAALRMFNAYNQIDPKAAMAALPGLMPTTEKRDIREVDGRLVEVNPDGSVKELLGKAAAEPKSWEPVTIYDAATGKVIATPNKNDPDAIARYQPYLDSGKYTTAKPERTDDKETWSMMSDADRIAAGLPEGFTYQRNSRGQVQKVTEPKQDKPSESENRFGYHTSRIANEMGVINDIVAKNGQSGLTSVVDLFGGPYALKGESQQRAENSYTAIVDSLLNLATGAAYTEKQLEGEIKAIKPLPTDTKQARADKLKRLDNLVKSARTAARAAGKDIEIPDISALFGEDQTNQRQASPFEKWQAGQERMILGAKVTRR